MLSDYLEGYNIILGSGSPRRKQLLTEMEIPFQQLVRPVEEHYPPHLKKSEITDFLTKLKAKAFTDLKDNEVLITCDTIVWHKDTALGKPTDFQDANRMLRSLSSSVHDVITSITFTSNDQDLTLNCTTQVYFRALEDEEINHYINEYKPYDKAGAYGIQEWIGKIGITKIEGSYDNVVGLPTHLFYKGLLQFLTNLKMNLRNGYNKG